MLRINQGMFSGYNHVTPEDMDGAELSNKEARTTADNFITKSTQINLNDYLLNSGLLSNVSWTNTNIIQKKTPLKAGSSGLSDTLL